MARKVLIIIFIAVLSIINIDIKANAEAVSMTAVKELIVKHSLELGSDPP